MEPRQRLTFLAIAAVIAIVAVVVLGSGGDDGSETTAATTSPAVTAEPNEPREAEPVEETETPKPEPKPPLLTANSGKTVRVEEGETVRFRVRHPTAEHVHVHGYDVFEDLEAGKPATIAFEADITGIFEIELEDSRVPLGSLRVDP